MSMRFQRFLTSLIHGSYGRWVMLGLLILILFTFTVTKEVGDWVRGFLGGAPASTSLAGSFSVLPGSVTNVEYTDFQAARERLGLAEALLLGIPRDRVRNMDVWTHLLLLEAAKKEGVEVAADDLRDVLNRILPDYIQKDQSQYRKWVQERFNVSAPYLEASLLEFLTALRVREVYRDSFMVAPAATREAVIEQAANQNIEYAKGDYAALDAARFLVEAETELKSEADPDAKLREFFDKDATVTLEPERFRYPARYKLEILYTIHKNVDTDEKLQRMEDVVKKAFPNVKLPEATLAERKRYYGTYRDRLLEGIGETLDSITKKMEDKEKEAQEPLDKRERLARFGYEMVKDQVAREVAVRTIYDFLYEQTKDNVSFKELYDKLQAQDDPEHPICSTEPGKGLFEYRDFDGKALSVDELQDIEDSGVKFGFSFRPRVTGVAQAGDLPKRSTKADTLGDAAHGRQIFRLLEKIPEQRKTFDELTAGEKEDLRRLFYLPEQARTRAKDKLESLRQALMSGEVKPEQFREKALELGCRVHEGEWFEASYDTVREPDKAALWPDEYLHMRDRYFLKKSLAQALDRDRAKPEGKEELKPPCYLPVDVDVHREADAPGSAYLFHLLERKKPDATTVSATEISRYLRTFANQRSREETDRWMNEPGKLITNFDMTFEGDMKSQIDDELRHREEARRSGKPR